MTPPRWTPISRTPTTVTSSKSICTPSRSSPSLSTTRSDPSPISKKRTPPAFSFLRLPPLKLTCGILQKHILTTCVFFQEMLTKQALSWHNVFKSPTLATVEEQYDEKKIFTRTHSLPDRLYDVKRANRHVGLIIRYYGNHRDHNRLRSLPRI